jgi:hypothetical protein
MSKICASAGLYVFYGLIMLTSRHVPGSACVCVYTTSIDPAQGGRTCPHYHHACIFMRFKCVRILQFAFSFYLFSYV